VSTSIFLRRETFDRIGNFDESLGLGCNTAFQSGEETDVLLRAISSGYKLYFDPALKVLHPHPLSPNDAGSAGRAWSYGLGMGRVLRMHGYSFGLLASHIAWPIMGAFLAMATGKVALAHLRLARAAGRISGWRWQPGMPPITTPEWIRHR
jgi:GT2 family glycosyltransferase